MAESDAQGDWLTDLEDLLSGGAGVDVETLKSLLHGHPVPAHLRARIWQACLGVRGPADALASWDGVCDLPEQETLHADCERLIASLPDEQDKGSLLSLAEDVLTFCVKSRGVRYEAGSGLVHLLGPLLTLNMTRAHTYGCLYALHTKYTPRDGIQAVHALRLLLQYHEPRLCSFLETKKISPDAFARTWLDSLFASIFTVPVAITMWDMILQLNDPFLVFFLILVILVNAKDSDSSDVSRITRRYLFCRESVLALQDGSREDILALLQQAPCGLQEDDIEDFCSLAQYYISRTPVSFRKEFQAVFGGSLVAVRAAVGGGASQTLCLPVSASEILNSSAHTNGEGVRFFVVDCRPAEQYNAAHLSTAFHLDPHLMLQNPSEFAVSVRALLEAQAVAMATGSVAGGEHLCFMGSGNHGDDDEMYLHMVLAHFLQKHKEYVSIARGGFRAVQQYLADVQVDADENPYQEWITSTGPSNQHPSTDAGEAPGVLSLVTKMTSALRSKSAQVRERVVGLMENSGSPGDRPGYGRPYRGVKPVFSIADEEECESDEMEEGVVSDDERREVVSLQTWLSKPDVKHHFPCTEIRDNGRTYACHLLVTATHLYGLRELGSRGGGGADGACIVSRRALSSVLKITSKKRRPELITFKFGVADGNNLTLHATDRYLIPNAGEATKLVKQQIMRVLDALET
ncbi:TBC1 domain family member 23 isoform X1 [Petromyzon marinus]|uniref:TBC1 domain family member 23 n=1 Tax=Petromyzon marinus TaxID=7757 RepID=A0AAJ7U239_PETMA|nr:TBC1 domain family member 23 isoform X1 [Petromyzon marinus]